MIALSPPPVLLPFLPPPMFLCRNIGRLIKFYCISTAQSNSVTEASEKADDLFAAFYFPLLLCNASFGKNHSHTRPCSPCLKYSPLLVFFRIGFFVLFFCFTLAVTCGWVFFFWWLLVQPSITVDNFIFFPVFFMGCILVYMDERDDCPKCFSISETLMHLSLSYISHCVCNHNKPSFSPP